MRPILFIGAVALCWGCVDKGPGGSGKKIDPAYIEQNLLTEPPGSLDNELNASLGEKVIYLGNEVEADTLAPGGKARVVHYWKVVEPPGADWRIFAHVKGSGAKDWMNVDYTDMRQGYPTSKWKAGDIIRDEQKFALASEWSSPHAELLVGMYPRGRHEPEARMPIVSGPGTDDHMVRAVRFQVSSEGGSESDEGGDYVVRKAAEPPTIDGKADEAAWAEAPWSPLFTDAEGGPAVGHDTRAKLLYDDDHLYAFIQVKDADVHSPFSDHDDTLWKADVVELFIDADRNRRGYVELQVNPNNAQLDSWFAHTRAQGGDEAFSANMKSAVAVHGTADDRKDTDTGWDAEIAIPLEAVKGAHQGMKVELPPQVGDRWNLNVVRVEQPKKGKIAASSWNQIPYSDWHAVGKMATVVFGDEAGSTEVAAEATDESDDGDESDEASDEGDEAASGEGEAKKPGAPMKRAVIQRRSSGTKKGDDEGDQPVKPAPRKKLKLDPDQTPR